MKQKRPDSPSIFLAAAMAMAGAAMLLCPLIGQDTEMNQSAAEYDDLRVQLKSEEQAADAPERAEVEPTQMPEATAEPTAEPENKKGFNDYGEPLDLTETDGICVLKYKITSSATKKMTVNQNYYTVVNFIKDGRGDQYDEIQYWAVADMQDGSESKVISFTVSKDLIEKIKAGTVLPTIMGDYVDELWLLPSLR